MKPHPSETDLALLAGGDCGTLSRFRLLRHVRSCAECEGRLAQFQDLRSELADDDLPTLDWDSLAAEIHANIFLGLEAGECVRAARTLPRWNPRIAVAFACLLLLIGANLLFRNPHVRPAGHAQPSAMVLESSGSGLEVRSGATSLKLLNPHSAMADQTVSAQGEIRARYIDGETGAVTINNVYLE